MLVNMLLMLFILALAVLFFWLVSRAGRIHNGILRWAGRILAGLLGLVVALFFIVASVGYFRLYWPRLSKAPEIQVQVAPEKMAEAERKASMCTGCHSSTGALPLDGSGSNFLGMPFGVLYPPNLTPGGALKDWSDGEIIRAIRDGVNKDGQALLVMPSVSFHNLSDEDVQLLVAYMRSQPAVTTPDYERSFTPVAAALIGAGMFPTSAQPETTGPVSEPQIGTVEYGDYIAHAYGCQDCHGADMAGLPPGGFIPAGPNLTQIVPAWTEEEFLTLFHEGKDPKTGRAINPDDMPWDEFKGGLTDDEFRSVYLYLHSLAPITKAP